jgi:hypothetical protein
MQRFSVFDSLAHAVRLALVVAACLVASIAAHAAPFCLQTEALPPQCIYYDADDCNRAARKQSITGTCSINPREMRIAARGAEYCVVTSERLAQCIYLDRISCDQNAARLHGVCTYMPTAGRKQPASGAPDPYAVSPGLITPSKDAYAPRR